MHASNEEITELILTILHQSHRNEPQKFYVVDGVSNTLSSHLNYGNTLGPLMFWYLNKSLSIGS